MSSTTETINAARSILRTPDPLATLATIAGTPTAREATDAARESQGWRPLTQGWPQISSN